MFGLVIGIVVLVYAIAAVVRLAGLLIGGLFALLGAAVSGLFSGEGLLLGIAIGLAAYLISHRNARRVE